MSREDRIRGILSEAGIESSVRRPADVISMPVRSAWLAKTAGQPVVEPEAVSKPEPAPKPEPHTGWLRHLPRIGEYLGLLCVLVALLSAFSWARSTLILADVGRSTCSTLKVADEPEAQIFWTEEDPASTVPKLKTRQFVACMKAGQPF